MQAANKPAASAQDSTADLVAAFLARGGEIKRYSTRQRGLPVLTERDWSDIVRGNATVDEIAADRTAARQPAFPGPVL